MPRFRDQLACFLNFGLATLSDFAIGRRHLHDGRFGRKRVLDRTCVEISQLRGQRRVDGVGREI